MPLVRCPKCSSLNPESGYSIWIFVVAIVFFPLGTIAFAAGKKKLQCANCSNVWSAQDEQKWWSFNHAAHAISIKFARIILCVGLVVAIFTLGAALPAIPPIVCMVYLLARLIWSLIYESGSKSITSSIPENEQSSNRPETKQRPTDSQGHNIDDYQELLTQAEKKKSAIIIENAICDSLQEPLTKENCKKVKELHLPFEGITDLTMLAELTELEFLELGGNKVADLTPLSNLIKLKKLYLNSNRISNLKPLANLVELTDLALINNLFTQSSDLSPLLGLKKMQRLFINQNPSLPKVEVDKVQLALPKCNIRHIDGCFSVFIILLGFGSAFVFVSKFI